MLSLIVILFSLVIAAIVVAAVIAPVAFILMILLGVLASVTGWACAIGFLPCFIITLIAGLIF